MASAPHGLGKKQRAAVGEGIKLNHAALVTAVGESFISYALLISDPREKQQLLDRLAQLGGPNGDS